MIYLTSIIGPAATGKSHVGRALAETHLRKGREVIFIDGNSIMDMSREGYGNIPSPEKNVEYILARDDNAKIIDLILVDSEETRRKLDAYSNSRYGQVHQIFTARG